MAAERCKWVKVEVKMKGQSSPPLSRHGRRPGFENNAHSFLIAMLTLFAYFWHAHAASPPLVLCERTIIKD